MRFFGRSGWVLAALLMAVASPAFAIAPLAVSKPADREALKRTLADVMDHSALHNARVSVVVRSLDDGSVIYSHNPDDLMNPASNDKLFTAAAALSKLGPEFRYDTEFLADEGYSRGTARNLYVRGKGDPSITTERLYGIVSELQHQGLKEITGDLIIDDSWFDPERTAPGFDQEDTDRAYMAPTGAVSLNWNAVGIYLRPGSPKPTVELEPPSDFFVVENGLSSVGKHYRRFSVASQPAGDKQRIVVRGSLPPEGSGVMSVWKKIDNPPMYFGQTFKRMLEERGIRVKGKVKVGLTPQNAKLVYVSQSETFDLVLKRMNKNSSNFIAETLIKTLGAEIRGAPGSFAKGISVVEEFLEHDVGIPRGSYVMKNGSGLNDTNRFSANQVTKLLKYMYEKFPVNPEYLSSMGIAGKDGTLHYRFEGSEAAGRLRAKTGTLENVCALSGYVQSIGGERFIFSTLVNDYAGRAGPVIQSIDALGVAMAATGSAKGPTTAVAEVMTQQTQTAPLEEEKARIKTYLALGKQGDARNVSFLRTAWRSEKDPAVRAVVAESIYRSNPEDYLGARALLDSVLASDEVYGRLRKVAKDLQIDVPGVGSVVELAAEGNTEAMGRLVELTRAAQGDAAAEHELSVALSEVARTAPDELLHVLKAAPVADRDFVTALLAKGLVASADADHPFWPALKKNMGSVDPQLAAFSKQLDVALSQKVAMEKAPKNVATANPQPSVPTKTPANATAETHPGG